MLKLPLFGEEIALLVVVHDPDPPEGPQMSQLLPKKGGPVRGNHGCALLIQESHIC